MLDNADFKSETRYMTVMNIVDGMLGAGLITESERGKINTLMLEKHRPVIGMLLAGKPLV